MDDETMPEDDDLEELRRRRTAEIRRQQADVEARQRGQEAVEHQRAQQEQELREQLMRQVLTVEARERLERLRLARPEEARNLENQLIALAQSGRLEAKIDDEQLKQILARLQPSGRDINIRRK